MNTATKNFDTMNSEYEKKWIVKSDSKILGPFSVEFIEELLYKRQISLIDEVRDMDQRWMYIREVPQFKQLVENVRIELDKKSEETKTIQALTDTETGQRTATRTEAVVLESAEASRARLASKWQILGVPLYRKF